MGQALDHCSVCQETVKAQITALGHQKALEPGRPPRPDFGRPPVIVPAVGRSDAYPSEDTDAPSGSERGKISPRSARRGSKSRSASGCRRSSRDKGARSDGKDVPPPLPPPMPEPVKSPPPSSRRTPRSGHRASRAADITDSAPAVWDTRGSTCTGVSDCSKAADSGIDSTSIATVPRHVCPQGSKCRRQRDPEHLAQVAHPFDPDYTEMCKLTGIEPELPSLRGLFDWVDVDNSGKISLKELEGAVPLLETLFAEPLHLSKKAWEHLDEDGNGCVNFSEFAAWAGPRLGLPLGVKHLFKCCSVMGCPCEKFECKPSKRRSSKSAARLQICKCGHKRATHDEDMNSRIEVPYPDYWTSRTGDFAALVPLESASSLQLFQKLLNKTYSNVWTRDRKKHNPDAPNVPKGFQVSKVWRSENSKYWQEYSVRRAELSKSRAEADLGGADDDFVEYSDLKTVKAWLKHAGSAGDRLRSECNEWYLFHGTTPEAANQICAGDFKIHLAGSSTGTLYGRGCYFSESITKADEYAKPNDDGERALILCRALGGRVRYTAEIEPDPEDLTESCIQGNYDCILGDREKCRNTFREFVFYDTENVYAEYVIYYKRIY